MTVTNIFKSQSDTLGVFASGICLLHCIATPFLFVSAASLDHHDHHHADSPFWWSSIDVIFIIISFIAVYRSARLSSKQWVKYALFASWAFLTFVLLNEKFEGIHLVEEIIYVPAFSLILLHLYNKRYCQCEDENCCVD